MSFHIYNVNLIVSVKVKDNKVVQSPHRKVKVYKGHRSSCRHTVVSCLKECFGFIVHIMFIGVEIGLLGVCQVSRLRLLKI